MPRIKALKTFLDSLHRSLQSNLFDEEIKSESCNFGDNKKVIESIPSIKISISSPVKESKTNQIPTSKSHMESLQNPFVPESRKSRSPDASKLKAFCYIDNDNVKSLAEMGKNGDMNLVKKYANLHF